MRVLYVTQRHEGLSVALVEAMAHGTPAIATRTGGLPELLGGGAGVLVQPGDAPKLADALGDEYDAAAIARRLVRWFCGEVSLAPAA